MGAVYSLYDRRDASHAGLRAAIEKGRDLIVLPAPTSVVAVAERLGSDRILTVDQRDFRIIRSARGRTFRLLPADLGK